MAIVKAAVAISDGGNETGCAGQCDYYSCAVIVERYKTPPFCFCPSNILLGNPGGAVVGLLADVSGVDLALLLVGVDLGVAGLDAGRIVKDLAATKRVLQVIDLA